MLKYCSICGLYYIDYLKHINIKEHSEKISKENIK